MRSATGLGLMISHRIVTDHGGAIELESRLGEGAVFRLRVPVGDLGAAPN